MSVTAFRHTGIVVQDMAAMLRFYRDLLGLRVWADFTDQSDYVQAVTGVPGADVHMVKLNAPEGGSIELLHYRSHPQPVPAPRRACDTGINHLALQVRDLAALHRRLQAEGVSFHCPPRLSSDGKAKVTYCRDPEGGIVELVEMLMHDQEGGR